MHEEILTKEQLELLPLNRRSIDFDLFSSEKLHSLSIKNRIKKSSFEVDSIIFESEQLHLVVNSVKISFVEFPFKIPHFTQFKDIITLPELIELAAMKAYALGERAKWKDYVDFYFLLKYRFKVMDIIKKAERIFGSYFNSKLFLEQLVYFEDIDYSETVEYIGEVPSAEEIKESLKEAAVRAF